VAGLGAALPMVRQGLSGLLAAVEAEVQLLGASAARQVGGQAGGRAGRQVSLTLRIWVPANQRSWLTTARSAAVWCAGRLATS
jgi:hypothetical protein